MAKASKYNPTPLQKKIIGDMAKLGKEAVEERKGYLWDGIKPGGVFRQEFFPSYKTEKISWAIQHIEGKHRVGLEVSQHVAGDFIVITQRDVPEPRSLQITRTGIETMGLPQLVEMIEQEFNLKPRVVQSSTLKGENPFYQETKTPTESWADEWAKKNT